MKKLLIASCLTLAACAVDSRRIGTSAPLPNDPGKPVTARLLYPYQPSEQCKVCHTDIFTQFEESEHSQAFNNPLFNAQYFREVVPRAQRDPAFVSEARQCLACHAPIVFMNYTGLVTSTEQAEKYETGVTCDFCHTLSGYGDNGDYLQNPSGKKLGPLQLEESHHAEYSGFLQLADFCGRCHNATNHSGLDVKSTYGEWRNSKYGKQDFACQECHMNKNGYLINGVAEYDSGTAAQINIGSASRAKQHQKLYSHAFPGAHSVGQLQDALQLEFRFATRSADARGSFPFTINVSNERSGHKMPTGSSDLRFMWLTVTATSDDGRQFPVSVRSTKPAGATDFSIAGAAPDDAAILGTDVPSGARLYRNVFLTREGRQSLFHFNSVKNVFDNRLNAAEVRHERFFVHLPKGYSGPITLSATLKYRGAPSSFAKQEQVPDFTPVVVAKQHKRISLVNYPAPGK